MVMVFLCNVSNLSVGLRTDREKAWLSVKKGKVLTMASRRTLKMVVEADNN